MTNRAVICVFDGLRADHVTPERTPHIHAFATGGTWLTRSRSVFPSLTRVCTASFATGAKPATHGIVDNAFFHPAVSERALNTAAAGDIDAAEAMHAGRFVPVPALGDVLAKAGKRYVVVHTGSAGSAYFVNHRAAANGHATFSIFGPAASRTPAFVDRVLERFGPIPEKAVPDTARMDYAARVFVEHVISEERPDVALVWFAEPDASFHYRGIGTDDANAVLGRVDQHFGTILAAVAADADDTAVIAMSDHGQITTTEQFDLFGTLTAAGIETSRRAGSARLLGVGGIKSGLKRADPDVDLAAVAGLLMELPQTGLLFCAEPVEGTLPHALVGLDHAHAPELIWVGRSDRGPDARGNAGAGIMTVSSDLFVGSGMHGGLNPIEQNTLLAFAGSGMPALGEIDDAADLTDIVPTLLTLLSCAVPPTMTGQPLPAILEGRSVPAATRHVEVSRGAYRQRVTFGSANGREVVLSGERLA